MRLFLRLCSRPCFPLCTPRCVHFVQGEVHSVGNVNLISRRGAAARIDIHSHTCVRAQSAVSFTRRSSSLWADFAARCHSPRSHTFGKSFPARRHRSVGLRPRRAERAEPGREGFPSGPTRAPRESLVSELFKSPHPFAVQLFFPSSGGHYASSRKDLGLQTRARMRKCPE